MSWLKDQLKMRDLKKVFKRIRDEVGEDGIAEEFEDYIKAKVIDILIDEITDDPMYKALIRGLVKELEEAI